MKKILSGILFVLLVQNFILKAQSTCSSPELFQTATYIKIAPVGTTAASGNYYGCAGIAPERPYFGLIKTCSIGNIWLNVGTNTDSVTLTVWGPFSDTTNLCSQLNASSIVFCNLNYGNQASFGPIILAQTNSTYLYMLSFKNSLALDSVALWYGGTYQPNDTCNICAGKVKALPNQQICLVTNDSASGKNKIIWEETNSADVHHYSILRETSVAGIFSVIAEVPKSSLSMFIDTVINPAQQSFKYKIASNDSCGNSASKGIVYSSSHVLVNPGFTNTANLIITPASSSAGQLSSTLYIYRGVNASSLILIDSVAFSASIFTYVDVNAPAGTLFYQVEQRKFSPCVASRVKSGWYESIKSNIAGVMVTGLSELETVSNVRLFPNPTNGKFQIYCAVFSNQDCWFELKNLTGEIIYSSKLQFTNKEQLIELPTSIKDGLYIGRLQDRAYTRNFKLIVKQSF